MISQTFVLYVCGISIMHQFINEIFINLLTTTDVY